MEVFGEKEVNNIMSKFLKFILLIIISVFLTFLMCLIHSKYYDDSILFNFTILIPVIVSILSVFIWALKYKDLFERFLVFTSILLCSLLIMYVGPFTINRSISTFIYFYTVENGQINKNDFNQAYLKKFINRRYKDSVDFGFLDCEDNICKPNIKTRIFYYILRPIGKITASDSYYKQFKEMQMKKDGI